MKLENNPGLKRIVWIAGTITVLLTAFGTLKANVNSVETTHHADSVYVKKTDYESHMLVEHTSHLLDSVETAASTYLILQRLNSLDARVAGVDSQLRCIRGQHNRC